MVIEATPDSEDASYESSDARLGLATNLVARYERRSVQDHPFFADLRSRPVDLGALWLLVANMRAGISRDFVVWLALTVARVDDRRIGSLVAKQLDDELGSGNFEHIHSVLLDKFVGALEPWRWKGSDAQLLMAGLRLIEEAQAPFHAAHPYESVGALISGEIFANKMDHCLGDEIRRQNHLSSEALTWLTVHETLEEHHAEDSNGLARLVPHAGPALAATWRGAEKQWDSLWRFLDRVQQIRLEHEATLKTS